MLLPVTSPLTLKPTDKKIPNSIYMEDAAGLWFDPDRVDVQLPNDFAKRSFRAASAAEQQADLALATALHTRYVKKPGRVLDAFSETLSLVGELEKLGHQALTSLGDDPGEEVKFDLITMVHTFQKIPARLIRETLQELSERLAPGGYIFIRMPDRGVAGFERDLTTDVMRAAPCFWNLPSFLELLAQIGTLKIIETYELNPGQRDYFLQHMDRKPRICAGMIVKNEERDLPRCLESIKDVVDGICVIDTGSRDNTIQMVQEWIRDTQAFRKPGQVKSKSDSDFRIGSVVPKFRGRVEQYLGASEQDETGDWKLWDFGKARNEFVRKIEEMADDFDYVLWMDADDKLLNPRELANLVYLEQPVIHGIRMQSGDIAWTHHRLWKTGKGIKFHGRCHEYPAWTGQDITHQHVTIYHDAAPGSGENANVRNRRILEREVQEAPTPRNCFYLANTHKDGGRYSEAIEYYDRRMQFGKGYEEEYWFAALYKARCLRNLRKHKEAEKFVFECLRERHDWGEFWMELGYLKYDLNDSRSSLAYCLAAADLPVPPSNLFRESNKYTDQPYRYASFAAERMGDKEIALKLAEKAMDRIGGPDADWEQRIETLKGGKPKLQVPKYLDPDIYITETKRSVCWLRPGALGDVLMTLNLIKPFRAENPNCEIVYQAHPSTLRHIEPILYWAGVDRVISTEEKFNSKTYNLIGYPLAEGYPEKPMKDHLVRYFAKDLGIQDLSDKNLFDNLTLEMPPLVTRNTQNSYCTMHVQAGWSPYKNWPMDRWQQIADRLMERGIAVVQIGGPDDPKIKRAYSRLGRDLVQNLEAMAHAKFHLGIDSWTNHATNIIWKESETEYRKTPALILWGSTQASAAGYAHNQNISLGLPCQPCFREDPKISQMSRGVCPNPAGQTFENPQHACMQGITVDRVWGMVESMMTSYL